MNGNELDNNHLADVTQQPINRHTLTKEEYKLILLKVLEDISIRELSLEINKSMDWIKEQLN